MQHPQSAILLIRQPSADHQGGRTATPQYHNDKVGHLAGGSGAERVAESGAAAAMHYAARESIWAGLGCSRYGIAAFPTFPSSFSSLPPSTASLEQFEEQRRVSHTPSPLSPQQLPTPWCPGARRGAEESRSHPTTPLPSPSSFASLGCAWRW
ncbi:hypothetical protein CLOM_g14342 [Closterium sp. NIES-68]|nr:hypothetical protein CLOM_g14342 [Closterium sp. NIES-68]